MSNVNHPDHYNLPNRKECIEQMLDDYGHDIVAIFCLTNAYKYLYRAGYKGDKNEDISKAEWYYNYFRSIEPMVTFNAELDKLATYIETELEVY